jgi:arylsulfatase A-like enzyme
MPSILAAAGVSTPSGHHLDGQNLLKILDGSEAEVERTFFWRAAFLEPAQKAVRRGRWKLIKDGNETKLFDLSTDISERRDVGELHPDRVAELDALIVNWEAEMPPAPTLSPRTSAVAWATALAVFFGLLVGLGFWVWRKRGSVQ